MRAPLLEIEDLAVDYGRRLRAVEAVSLGIAAGETLGLIGESGSGKTTIGRAILRRVPTAAGRIRFDGADITKLSGEPLRRLRRRMQLVFQDPYASLNPRMRVRDIVGEPLVIHGLAGRRGELERKVAEMLDLVGLPPDAGDRLPAAFSGGQRQRIGLARALALGPDLVVADEPVSALDVSVRAQVVNLMQALQQRLGTAYLFIAHDLAIVRHISHRVAILYAGRLVELAPTEQLFARPRHPYTETLLEAVLPADPVRARRPRPLRPEGEPPDPANWPPGCRFAARCPIAVARCRTEAPPLVAVAPGHVAACWERTGGTP